MSNALDTFRDNLRTACERKGISQQELSRKSDVHYVTINRIFRGHITPTIPVAEKLARAVGFSLEKIFAKRS
mgnify:CR=1 FL=1